MIERCEARKLLLELLEEAALLVGGILAVHNLDDEAVWKLMRGLDSIRRNSLARLEASANGEPLRPEAPSRTAHPAVEEFLVRLQKERKR